MIEVGQRVFLRHKFEGGHTEEYSGTVREIRPRGL